MGAEIEDGDWTWRLELPVGSGETVVERVEPRDDPDEDADPSPHTDSQRTTAPYALAVDRAAEIAFEVVDDRVAVSVDGDEIIALEYRSIPDVTRPPPPSRRAALRLLGHSTQAEFRSIRVDVDLHYLDELRNASRPQYTTITLGEGEYFFLGDNTASSSDGRYWGHVPEQSLMGRALLVFWPAWPHNFQCKFIR